jgi:hypothetical protein
MLRAMLLQGLVVVCLSAGTDAELVLQRIREGVSASLLRMPNYTCVETVTRQYFRPNVERPPDSCGALAQRKQGPSYRLLPASTDRLRLDVSVTPAREWYSWAGAASFDSRDLSEIIGGGPIGTGAFGAFLMSIFGESGAFFTYAGETTSGGRNVTEFSYRMAKEKSSYRIRTSDGWVIAGYNGSIFADTETGDLVRLTVRTEELPPATGSCETSTRLDYGRVAIGESSFLMPVETRQRFVLRNGVESENTSSFSACREYRGQSTVRFAEEGEGGGWQEAQGNASRPWPGLPVDLPVTLELAAPIDTWTASAGDTIPMRLAKSVVGGDGEILLAGGTAIQGRLIRVQRYFTSPPRSTVVIEPESIELDGARFPFFVLPGAEKPSEPVRTTRREWIQYAVESALPNESTYGVWSLNGSHVIVPKGYRTHWVTAAEPRP